MRIFTWHVHGNYLYYLSQSPHTFYLPVSGDDRPGYGGKTNGFSWGKNVVEIPLSKIHQTHFDCILFQSEQNYLKDQYEILSSRQRMLPKIYLEHNPPQRHPTNEVHPVAGDDVTIVHVTQFNQLMWDNQLNPTVVIEHGIPKIDYIYEGTISRGVTVVNNLKSRGRRLGLDIFQKVRQHIPIDVIGMGSEEVGGLGEISHDALAEFISKYRFFFNPIRYTSLGLSVCEAMMVGLPIIGVGTTEMGSIIQNNVNGYVETDVNLLITKMQRLLDEPGLALKLSIGSRLYAMRHFAIDRFITDWNEVFEAVIQSSTSVNRKSAFIHREYRL